VLFCHQLDQTRDLLLNARNTRIESSVHIKLAQGMTGLEHEVEEGGAHDASLSANNFTCAICFELLLDPVVGE
jgi:hypothetical protein